MAFQFAAKLHQQELQVSELRAQFTARFFVYYVQTVRMADGNESGPALRGCVGFLQSEVQHEMNYSAVARAMSVLLIHVSHFNLPALGMLHSQICYVFQRLTASEQSDAVNYLVRNYYDFH